VLGVGIEARERREHQDDGTDRGDAGDAEEAAARALEQLPEGKFVGLENAAAAAANELVVLSVPFRSQSETLTNLKGSLRPGQLVLDATVPLAAAVSGKATRMLGVWQGSAAEQAQEMVPEGVTVVAGLHTVSAAILSDLDHSLDEDVLICGDKRADKARIAALIARIDGLRPLDAGRLEMARIVESLTALLISVNVRYKTHAGLHVTGLPDTLW
jgi:NADPH-dependent F420 reductase